MMTGKRHALCFIIMLVAVLHGVVATAAVCDTVRHMTDSTYRLHEVVATAQRNQTPHQTMLRAQLEGIASGSIADALKYMEGVQIKDYGGLGGQKTVNVR